MYVCICMRVRERELRAVIQRGARTEETVGDECGAGTRCGTCLDRICDLIDEESDADTRVALAA
jgi:bacterioferritin-associated ferredoxin